MKMEINVDATDDLVGQTVVAVIAKPGSSVSTGDPIVVTRKE
jgi:biotin carboxyl carrier protein